jgi:hypothetical protein
MKNEYLRIIDNADTVASRLKIVKLILNSDGYDHLSLDDLHGCSDMISDILSECITMLTLESEVSE